VLDRRARACRAAPRRARRARPEPDRLSLVRSRHARARPRGARGAGYELERVEAFDLFPQTPHVEVLAPSGVAEP
jgi:hypothetical protein